MLRDIWTNKWILGSLGFVILFTGARYFWYQHETAPLRQPIDVPDISRNKLGKTPATVGAVS